MDRSISVTTPESIAFSYELAGLGTRFLAVAVDTAIQFGMMLLVLIATILVALTNRDGTAAAAFAPSWARSAAIAAVVALVFAVFFGYFIVFEGSTGRTPGKRLLGVRVIRDGGFPLDPGSAAIRNLVRVVEVAFGFYAISIIAALLSPQNKRLGDMAAGTLVVRDVRTPSLASLAFERSHEGPDGGALAVDEAFATIAQRFLERRETLTQEARATLALRIAQRLRETVPDDLRRLDDESLIERVSASSYR